MKKNGLIIFGIYAMISIFMVSCGDSAQKTTPAIGGTPLEENIQKVVDWSKGTGAAPTEADYIAAGVDLNGKSVDDVNEYIRQLQTPSKVDTIEEIEAIAVALGVTIVDTDADGTYDVFDTDDDNDGVLDSADAFPLDSTESIDTDGDGVGDNEDTDDDNDGIADVDDDTPKGEDPIKHAPVGSIVRTGLITNVIVGTQVNLTSESNDSDGDTLRYVWYIDEKPAGSSVSLDVITTQNLSFTADKVGTYEIIFQVHDADDFDQDSITIIAEAADTCTELNNGLSADTTFHANKCYKADNGLRIGGITLTIEEGVQLIIGSNKSFNISSTAKIIANGSAENPIIFTSDEKTVGEWNGLEISSEGNESILSHVTIEYAKTAISVGIEENSTLRIEDCILKNSEKYGIKNNSIGYVDINNTQFIENDIPLRVQKTNKLYQLNNSNTFTNNTHSYIESFSSEIITNQTWKKLAVPYYIWGVDVEKNATLTIEAGVKIFNAGGKIDVEGTLKAIGTQENPIIFTRDPNDTRGNEYWYGIRLDTNSYYKDIAQEHELAFVQIDYAEIGLKSDGEENAHFKFSDSNITNSKYRGLELNFGKGHIDKFERINLKNNNYGAYLSANSIAYIDTASDFTGNNIDAIVIPAISEILNRGNHTWKKMSVPISVGSFNVPENVVLNIEAGNEIIAGNHFWVNGSLNIVGTQNDMVTFKGGTTLGQNGLSYMPSQGIYFSINENSENSNISYLSIDGTAPASNYNHDGIRVTGSNVINNQIVPWDAIVNIENSVFNNIAGNGILVDCGPNVTQSNNTFTNITDLDVRRDSCD